MSDKVGLKGVGKFLPYIGKEMPTKVEKDFTVILMTFLGFQASRCAGVMI